MSSLASRAYARHGAVVKVAVMTAPRPLRGAGTLRKLRSWLVQCDQRGEGAVAAVVHLAALDQPRARQHRQVLLQRAQPGVPADRNGGVVGLDQHQVPGGAADTPAGLGELV